MLEKHMTAILFEPAKMFAILLTLSSNIIPLRPCVSIVFSMFPLSTCAKEAIQTGLAIVIAYAIALRLGKPLRRATQVLTSSP